MKDTEEKIKYSLNDDDKAHISEIFYDVIVPKLRKLNARLGNLSCEFAGEQYINWNLNFRSAGSDYVIVDFDYDEDGAGIDLDL